MRPSTIVMKLGQVVYTSSFKYWKTGLQLLHTSGAAFDTVLPNILSISSLTTPLALSQSEPTNHR